MKYMKKKHLALAEAIQLELVFLMKGESYKAPYDIYFIPCESLNEIYEAFGLVPGKTGNEVKI